MNTIKVKAIRISVPTSWENKHGIRVFFDHEEPLLDEYANRNSRPVREYNRIIREQVVPKLEGVFGTLQLNRLGKFRIVPVPNQFPFMAHMSIEWLPRTAHCVREVKGRIMSFDNMDYEIVVTVEDL